MSPADSPVYDCIIVGAGFSGLAAATKLSKANKKFLVLEANDRVGGKVYDKPIPNGTRVECGAAFTGPHQDRLLELVEELGMDTFPTHTTGSAVYFFNGERIVHDKKSALPLLGENGMAQMGECYAKINAMAQSLDAAAPWTSLEAASYDSMTFATWLDQNVTHVAARKLLTLSTRALFSAEPVDLSLLQVLTYTRRAGTESVVGTFQRLTSSTDGAQGIRFVQGPQTIALKLAEKLGNRVQLNSPVRTIRKRNDIYEVSGDSFPAVSAHHIILALSPPLAGRILYEPALPARRDQLTQRMPMGSLGKAIAVYKTPFWRDEGLSGEARGLDGVTVQCVFDVSPSNASCGILLGFIVGNAMRKLDSASEQEIQELVTDDYVRYFGPKARDVEHWVIQRWDNEEFAKGGHMAVCPPGVMTHFGEAIAEPVGGMFMAGTEAATYWAGYMEGALRAGESAAKRVCERSG